MPFRAFCLWKTKIASVYFIFVLVSIFNIQSWTNPFSFQLELLTFILKYCHSFGSLFKLSAFVHCVRYAQDNIIMLILIKLLSWNLAQNLSPVYKSRAIFGASFQAIKGRLIHRYVWYIMCIYFIILGAYFVIFGA